jgi:hypothetical protein
VKHGPGRNATFEAAEAGHHHVLHLLLKVRKRQLTHFM